VCAAPAPGSPPRQRITPVQWVGLAVLVLLFLSQTGLLNLGRAGGVNGLLTTELPRVIALIIGITVHEFSHGLVATWFGDDVPRRAGRLTLNPLKHLDPLGTILIFIGPIGWGRPMPINPSGMRNPGLGWALSSAAGPLSNLIVATIATLVYVVAAGAFGRIGDSILLWIVELNVALAVFNLVPLPPLDGFGFVFGLSPQPLKQLLAPVWQIGPILLLALLFLPGLIPGFPPFLTQMLSGAENAVFGILQQIQV
jgi:Zn-dependent protease